MELTTTLVYEVKNLTNVSKKKPKSLTICSRFYAISDHIGAVTTHRRDYYTRM